MTSITKSRLSILSRDCNGMAMCLCSCGTRKVIRAKHVTSGRIKSCGCLRRENKPALTHGMTYAPEYKIWEAMKRRCLNVNDSSYERYGGRGIKVCDRWLHSFENFYSDLGPRPSSQFCIERKDNNGNYEPGNCCWATRKQEARNTRRSRWIEIDGVSRTLPEWAEIYHQPVKAVYLRIFRRGWNPKTALVTPMRKS